MPNSLDLSGEPSRTRVVVAMSGGVDSSVVAALLKREGYDVVGITLQLYDYGAAAHRKGACCAGQDMEDARRVADAIRHSPLRARLRGALPGSGDRPLRRELSLGRDADPVRRVQPLDQVPRPFADRAGSRGRGAGDGTLRGEPGAAGWTARALSRRRSRARPELFPVRHHAGAVGAAALSARRARQGARRARWPANSAWRSPTRPTARTSASSRRGATATSSTG